MHGPEQYTPPFRVYPFPQFLKSLSSILILGNVNIQPVYMLEIAPLIKQLPTQVYRIQLQPFPPKQGEEKVLHAGESGETSLQKTLSWHERVWNYKHALSAAKSAYFSFLISNNKHSSIFLSQTAAKLT